MHRVPELNLYAAFINAAVVNIDFLGLDVEVVRVAVPPSVPPGAEAGYTVPSVSAISMTVETDSSCSPRGCWRLKVISDSTRIEWWATHDFLVPHEQLHIADFTYYHNRAKAYALSRAECYSTKSRAECWKRAATLRGPQYYYWLGLYNSTIVRDGWDHPTYRSNRDAAKRRLRALEVICASL